MSLEDDSGDLIDFAEKITRKKQASEAAKPPSANKSSSQHVPAAAPVPIGAPSQSLMGTTYCSS